VKNQDPGKKTLLVIFRADVGGGGGGGGGGVIHKRKKDQWMCLTFSVQFK